MNNLTQHGSNLSRYGCASLGFLALVLAWMPAARAQSVRDPTVAPPMVGATDESSGAQLKSSGAGGRAILVRDGLTYLVEGTRLYAKGETLGQARIVRISETEVWLSEAGQLKKIPVFSGVVRRAAVPVSASSAAQDRLLKPHPTLSKP